MKKTMKPWIYALLTITLLSCGSDKEKNATINPTDDNSQFVTLTDVVPDAILEIRYFYPDLDKSVLFKQDYICEKSGHTRGSTVDLRPVNLKPPQLELCES